jgi:F-type H+-transporting ATPase subunit epsilon
VSETSSSDRGVLNVSVVTPEGAAFEGTATHVVAPAFDGEVAFYPLHAPYVGVLGYGELRITRPCAGSAEDRTEFYYLAGGVVQVADDSVTILAERITAVADLDPSEAETMLAEALGTQSDGDVGLEARLQAMEDARARLRTSKRAASRGGLSATETVN